MITYETAEQMKKLGLPQKHHKNAKYYVTPDIIMDFEAIHDLKDAKAWLDKRFDEQVNWMEYFTYIPELIDLIGVQSYNLTLDAAAWHFIDNHKDMGGVITGDALVLSPDNNLKTLPLPEATIKADKQTVITDATLKGIERIKQAIQANATQAKI